MGTISTDRWLQQFILRYRENAPIVDKIQLQLETLIHPLLKTFVNEHPILLHRSLLENGLFYPDEEIENEVKQMKEANMWKVVQASYLRLKERWNGPKAKIILLPVTRRNEAISKLGNKTGISYRDKIILFVSSEISKAELQALLIHEYNHVCRLQHINKSFKDLTLLDSLVIEGLAEAAVEEILGKDYIAIWTKLYQKEDIRTLWETYFHETISLKGKENHSPYLFGSRQIPRWAGYAVGYHMIKEAQNHNRATVSSFMKKTSEELLKMSQYPTKMNR